MPRHGSTKNLPAKENVQYIIKGSDPVFSTLVILTFILLLVGIVLQYMELRDLYGYGWAIFFETK